MMIRYRGGSQLDTGCSANLCGDVNASTLLLLLLLLVLLLLLMIMLHAPWSLFLSLARFFLAFSHYFLRRDCETCRSVHGQNMAPVRADHLNDALINCPPHSKCGRGPKIRKSKQQGCQLKQPRLFVLFVLFVSHLS